jgi:hypothetical protein
LIHIQEQVCQTWFHELQTNTPLLDSEHLDEWLVYSFRINRVEAVLKWLKVLEQQVERLDNQ